ncbi:MAG: sulfatase-like hydrolase/transferase [Bacteroidales bacterium]
MKPIFFNKYLSRILKRSVRIFLFTSVVLLFSCEKSTMEKPNVLFILMDDLGYGHLGINNDTLEISDFDPFFVYLVDSLQGYSLEKALEFTKRAIPTISNLANEGIRFTRAHTTCNVCAPSRLGIATGTLQTKFGVYLNGEQRLKEDTHLAENMKNLGYQTAHIGKWHIGESKDQMLVDILKKHGIEEQLGYNQIRNQYPEIFREVEESGYRGSVIDAHHPLNNGFDYYYGYNYWASQFYNSTYVWENFTHAGRQDGYNTDVFTDVAIDYMDNQIDRDKPFYVQLHYHAVHDSLEPKAPDLYFNRFDAESYHLNNFYAHIYGVDYNINRIVEFLKSTGAYENTLIFFTSDNGAMCMGPYDGHKTGSPLPANAPFSGHKGTYYEGGIRVPMFVHWPEGIKQTGVSHQLISTMDIIPTAIDVAGGAVPEGIDGKSLVPLFSDPDGAIIHDHLIWAGSHAYNQGFLVKKTNKTHTTAGKYGPPAWVVIKGDYLLRFMGELVPGIYLEHMDGREPIVELYNIKLDPAERNNLADKLPEKTKEMSEYFFRESKDFITPVHWDLEKWQVLFDSKIYF